jgi:hypothetical protein
MIGPVRGTYHRRNWYPRRHYQERKLGRYQDRKLFCRLCLVRKQTGWWLDALPGARRLTPEGDPAGMLEAGEDVKPWVIEGLRV